MSTPGNGAIARVISATSGREWYGEVLVWGPRGEPFLRDAETAELRWFPRSWVREVADGPDNYDRGLCECSSDLEEPRSRACPHHGDPEVVASNILKAARSKP